MIESEISFAARLDLARLKFSFQTRPLLIGGKAMEYYGLRPAGADIDFVITAADYDRLARRYPEHLKDLWGDLGVFIDEFEIWKSICLFTYEDLAPGAVELAQFRVVSLEKLLVLKTLAMKASEKYARDVDLIVQKLKAQKYSPWWDSLTEEQRQHYTSV